MSGISGTHGTANMHFNSLAFHNPNGIPYMEASTILERPPPYTEEFPLRTTNGMASNGTPSSSGASTPVEPTSAPPASSSTNQARSTPQVIPGDHHIPLLMLNVDGITYEEHRHTLSVSPVLRALINHWESTGVLDGIHWIDADPYVFEHILTFMRPGATYPLLWTADAGFDYNMYNRLLAAATQFELWNLRDWIAEQRYLDAVTSVVQIETLDEQAAGARAALPRGADVVDMHTHMWTYQPSWIRNHQNQQGTGVCACPCVHHEVFQTGCIACETACMLPGYGAFEGVQKRLTIVTRTIAFHPEVCVVERD